MNFWKITLATTAAGAGISAWGAFHPASQLFGRTLRHTGNNSTLALTFDDGPNPEATPRLLDLLDRHQARSTFFLIGAWARRHPALVREIAARGHTVGNHTETHPNLLWLSPRQIADEVSRSQEAIEHAAGQRVHWIRPPYGFRGPQLNPVVKEAGFAGVVMWSLSVRDWNSQPASQVISRLGRARGGQIILLHDGDARILGADRRHTIDALEFWLPRWRDAGLVFAALDTIGRELL
jgi:peptidoglycan/xylan/chitin deacetylase (PgdA/CDA1 family)